eukprot:scaffold3685_cov242-Pinguiococcus_pyrenoidosus.AAC.2
MLLLPLQHVAIVLKALSEIRAVAAEVLHAAAVDVLHVGLKVHRARAWPGHAGEDVQLHLELVCKARARKSQTHQLRSGLHRVRAKLGVASSAVLLVMRRATLVAVLPEWPRALAGVRAGDGQVVELPAREVQLGVGEERVAEHLMQTLRDRRALDEEPSARKARQQLLAVIEEVHALLIHVLDEHVAAKRAVSPVRAAPRKAALLVAQRQRAAEARAQQQDAPHDSKTLQRGTDPKLFP